VRVTDPGFETGNSPAEVETVRKVADAALTLSPSFSAPIRISTMRTTRFTSLRSFLTASLILAACFTADLNAADAKSALPRLVDLGAGKCTPCKQMKPILEELTRDYAGQFDVVFIDVWENRDEGKRYGIRLIPTQIFFAADGKELARHEGFMSKKDILAKWTELGVALKEPAAEKGN
jgi:thioredoxin 1